jgi:CHAT domain-containing protein
MTRHGLTGSRPVSFSFTLLIALIAMSQMLVFSQSASLATLPIKDPQPVKIENSSAAKLVAEGLRIEEPATADSRRNAIEKYLQAIPLWQAAKDTAAEARTLALIAGAYIGLGEKQNAFDFANRALPLSEKAIKDCSEQEKPAAFGVKAYVLDTLGRANQDFGDRKKARELYNDALSLSQSIGDRSGELNSLINLGKASILLSDFPKALELSERALRMVNELGERRKETIVLNNLCLIHQQTGAFEKAFEMCKEAVSTARGTNNRLSEANAIQNLGSIYYRTGDYQKAIDFYGQSKQIFKELGNRRGEATAITNIGWLYAVLGDLQKANDAAHQALELWRALGDQNREVIVLNNLAVNYFQLSDYRKALEMHLQILPVRKRLNESEGTAVTLENIAQCFDSLGETQKAIEYHEQAITLLREGSEVRLLAGALRTTGESYRLTGNHQKALEFLTEALKIFRQVGDRYNEGVALAETAYLERDRGNLFEAKKLIGQGLAALESVRTSVKSQQLRATFLASAKNYYEFETDLLMRLHQQHPGDGYDAAALASSEKGRARSLLELLVESRAEIREGVDSALLAREQELRDSIAEKAEHQIRLLSAQHTDEAAEKASKEIDALTTEYEQVLARIRETSPRYAALTQPLPLSLKDIQTRVLDSETLLLEYSLGEERSFLWAITQDSISTFELPKRQDVEVAARKVYELVTERNRVIKEETLAQRRLRVARSDEEYQRAASVLSDMILQPAVSQLKGKRLLFVGDGVLQYVPFASLPVPTAGPASSYRPLILDHEIINLPSASVMAALREETAGRSRASKTLAVLADPVFQNDDPRIGNAESGKISADASTEAYRSAKESGLDSFVRLRFTREEANEITRLVSSDKRLEALDFAASRANATSAALGQYQIVHFATHGLINNRHPELSGIVLSLVDEKGQAQNGFLRLYEIYNLKLGADLVVLSACQTAVGQEVRGEGLLGLTRGFMYAGAPRVVATLWQVDDRATSELMKRFYQKMLGEGLRPAAALKAAQVSMQSDKRWGSPHFWAAFTLHGDWK